MDKPRRHRKKSAAEPLRDIMPAVLRQSEQQRHVLDDIQRVWTGLVGPELSGHTRPVSLRRGRLIVHVDQPGDNFALAYQRESLLTRLRASTDGRVEELVIRVGEF